MSNQNKWMIKKIRVMIKKIRVMINQNKRMFK